MTDRTIVTDGGEVIELPDDRCRWFCYFFTPYCNGCGLLPHEHDGIEWAAFGTGPFGTNTVRYPWSDYGPGRAFNVPMLNEVTLGKEYLNSLLAAFRPEETP